VGQDWYGQVRADSRTDQPQEQTAAHRKSMALLTVTVLVQAVLEVLVQASLEVRQQVAEIPGVACVVAHDATSRPAVAAGFPAAAASGTRPTACETPTTESS